MSEQGQYAERLIFNTDRRTDTRSKRTIAWDVVDQLRLDKIPKRIRTRTTRRPLFISPRDVLSKLRPIFGEQREIGLVVRHDALRNTSQMLKDLTDLQRAREGGQQIMKRLERLTVPRVAGCHVHRGLVWVSVW